MMKFDPTRVSAALSLFGTAVITLFTLVFSWAALVVLAVGGVWAGAMGLFNALFITTQVTPNFKMDGIVHDTIISLAPFTPVVTDVVVPLATSALIDGPKVSGGDHVSDGGDGH